LVGWNRPFGEDWFRLVRSANPTIATKARLFSLGLIDLLPNRFTFSMRKISMDAWMDA